MHPRTWKVGDVAKRTGLSVRTLRHYETIGLLEPAVRSEAGHRLYSEVELERLQRILSLRQLGLALGEIRQVLDEPGYALAPLVELHLARLAGQIALQQRLHQRLAALRARLLTGEDVPAAQLFDTMEAITMIDKYLTPEQIQVLDAHRAQLGGDAIQAFRAVMDELRQHLQAHHAPTSPEVQAVGLRLRNPERIKALGGDAALGEGLQRMLANEPAVRERLGLDDALFAYLGQVMKGLG